MEANGAKVDPAIDIAAIFMDLTHTQANMSYKRANTIHSSRRLDLEK